MAEELRLALRRVGDAWQIVLDPGGDELSLDSLDEIVVRLRRMASAGRSPPRGLR